MDPLSVALLAGIAGSLGTEAGRDTWQGLVALVRRPFRRTRDADGDGPQPSTGEPELAALAQHPTDATRAHALSTALAVRAALDAGFRQGLEEWHRNAERAQPAAGNTTNNTISGGTFHSTVIQAGSVSGLQDPTQG